MNRVILMGRLTKEPMVTTTQNGKKVARYTLAVDRDKDHADFISCVTFDKGAEFAQNWLHQGTKIAVEGRITTGSYTNRDGQKVYTTDVIVDRHEFAEGRAEAERNSVSGTAAQEQTTQEQATQASDGFMNIEPVDDDGLPFM